MLILTRLLLTLILLTMSGLCVNAQSISVRSARIGLLEGNVIGASFDDGKDAIIVQQSVISTTNGGLVFQSSREITSWSLKNNLQIARHDFGMSPSGSPIHPCGRVEVVPALGRAYICSAQTNLEILDAATLSVIGRVADEKSQNIYDFTIDDQRDTIFVLSLRSDMSVRLAAYALKDGAKLQEIVLSQAPSGGAQIALESRTGQVVVTESHQSGHEYLTRIRLCQHTSLFSCSDLASIEPVSQMAFLGRQLLVATRNSATDKKDCILGVNTSTRITSHSYCSRRTGVHFAVGVILDRYVVGFTGTTKTHAFLEYNTPIQSSFSIWRAEEPKVVATVIDPTDYGASQYEVRVGVSRTTPRFLTYATGSNALYVYSIMDSN